MKTKEEMIERYNTLYEKMAESQNPKNMKIFGEAERHMFKELAAVHPEMAEIWLSRLEAVCWNNYLSEREAINIGRRIVNQNGIKGFHWNYENFCNAVKGMNGNIEDKPYYNSYALFVAANMIYSDHANSISEDMGYKAVQDVPNEKMALSCYKKAVEILKDEDGGFRIRKYFKHWIYESPAM
jgi:hypothetical protein